VKSLILILVLVALGSAAGIGAGLYLAPAPKQDEAACGPGAEAPCEDETDAPSEIASPDDDATAEFDYAKMANQFVIPVIREERVVALVVLSVTLEVDVGASSEVFDREPRIRDAFLQKMFDFAYLGGFDGPFTKAENLATLRRGLREIAQRIAGPVVNDVLIIDLVRQEV